ncbi:MAG TPA: hypothetical protein PL193_02860 [Xanthobacteraceae bacterium]|nr:hypothetical protein [Xanthobacteraceae bacterium]
MSKVHCFTSATFAYLDRVRILGATIRKYHPDWTFTFCLSDEQPEGFHFDAEQEPFDRLVHISDLPIENLRSWMFEHDIVELCTAVKGVVLCEILSGGADKVVYLDPDIAIFSPLEEVVRGLDLYDVILTPHQIDPDTKTSAIIDNEIGSLKHGIFNLGFVAVANTADGVRFAKWWRDRLIQFCFDDIAGGLFTDQKWCDHAPVFFPNTHILRHRGYNVASWNLSQRPVSFGQDGSVLAGGEPIRFFHFTKVNWVGEAMLERYSGDRIEVFELMQWYRDLLSQNSARGLPERWWAYGSFADGDTITKNHRLAYRHSATLKADYPNPYVLQFSVLEQFKAKLERRYSELFT